MDKHEQDHLEAAASGDRLETLIAERLQNTGARDTASLSRRLMQVVEEIEALQNEREIKLRGNTVEMLRANFNIHTAS